MDGHHNPPLHRIEHPVALILQRLMEDVEHVQA